MWMISYFSGLLLAAFLWAKLLPGQEHPLGSDLSAWSDINLWSGLSSWSGPFWFGLPFTLGFLLLTVWLFRHRKEGSLWRLSLMLLLGWTNCWWFAVDTATPLLNHVGEEIRIRGVVLEQPKAGSEWLSCQVAVEQIMSTRDNRTLGRDQAAVLPSRGQVMPRLPSEEQDLPVTCQKIQGKVMLQVQRPQVGWAYGDLVELEGKLELPPKAANPGQFDYRRYLAYRGVYLTLKCPAGESVKKLSTNEANLIQRAALLVRAKLAATGSALFPGQEGQILNGMVLGASAELDPELRQTFNMSGLSHLLSVSGFHVALVAALPILLGRYWLWSEKTTFGVTAIVVLGYALISGLSPPVVRSAIMVILGLFAVLFKLHKDWGRILALAALLTTFPYPLVSSEPGYQLSFAATWAILALTPLLTKLFRTLPLSLPDHILALFSVPLAALLGTWPLVAYHFNQFSLISLPANLLLVDLAGIILILGLLMAVLGLFSLGLAGILQPGLGLLLKLFIRAAEYFAGLPGAVLSMSSPSILSILSYFFLLWLLSTESRRALIRKTWQLLKFHWCSGSYSRSGSLSIVALLLVLFAVIIWWWPQPNSLQVTFLDVGEGDSIYIKTPSGKTMLIDTGRLQVKQTGEIGYDAGEKVVLPFLRSQGVNKLDLLVITHPHLDHFGGAASLLEQIPVEKLLISQTKGTDPLFSRFLTTAKTRGTALLEGRQGQEIRLDPVLKLYILNAAAPENPQTSSQSPDSHLNNQSLVIKLTYDECSFLFTGDLEQEAISQLMSKQREALQATVLKVSHHGSKTGYSPEFYRLVNPHAAVISVGTNLYGHPHHQVVRYFQEQTIPLLRTDKQGAVTFWSDGQQAAVENFTQGEIK